MREETGPSEAVPWYRRPLVLAASLGIAGVIVAAAIVLGTRSSDGGLESVSPNALGVIDPETNQLTDEVPVGVDPVP